jgi:hypothetical protein
MLLSKVSSTNITSHKIGIEGDFKKAVICFKKGMQQKKARRSTTPDTVAPALCSIHTGN